MAGATGELGRAAIPPLIEAGHEVVGSARAVASAEVVRSLGAEARSVDLFDPEALKAAISGCDAVIRLTTKIPSLTRVRSPRAWEETNRLRTEGARLLLDAVVAAGCGTYISESITFPYADGGDSWLTEDSPVDAASWPVFDAVLAGEDLAEDFTAGGGKGVVLRFSTLYSNDDALSREIRQAMGRRMFPIFGSGDAYVSPLWIPDAGAAIAASLNAPPGVYNVCDDAPMRVQDYAATLTRAWQVRSPLRLPRALAPLLLGGAVNFLLRSQRVSNERFKRTTGWALRAPSIAEGLVLDGAVQPPA